MYTHTLTATEVACGVTLERVAEELPRGLFIDNGLGFVTPDLAPALAGSVARAAYGAPVEYFGLNAAGLPVYRPNTSNQALRDAYGPVGEEGGWLPRVVRHDTAPSRMSNEAGDQ